MLFDYIFLLVFLGASIFFLFTIGEDLELKLENSSLNTEDIKRILVRHGLHVYTAKNGKLQLRGKVAMLNLSIEKNMNHVLIKGGCFIYGNPDWYHEHWFYDRFVPFYGLVYSFKRRKERKELFNKIAEILKNPDVANELNQKKIKMTLSFKEGYVAAKKNGRLYAVTNEEPNEFLCPKCYTRVSTEYSSSCVNCGSSLMEEDYSV